MRSRQLPNSIYRLQLVSLVSATLLLFLTSFLPLTAKFLNSQVLAQTPTTQDRKTRADRLYQQGIQQLNRRQLQPALRTFQQVLTIRRQLGDRKGEAQALYRISNVYDRLGQKKQADNYFRQARAIPTAPPQTTSRMSRGTFLRDEDVARVSTAQERKTRADRFYQQGLEQLNKKQSQAALQTFQQVLTIRRQLGDRKGESLALFQIGKAYEQLGQKNRAQQYYREARERLEGEIPGYAINKFL